VKALSISWPVFDMAKREDSTVWVFANYRSACNTGKGGSQRNTAGSKVDPGLRSHVRSRCPGWFPEPISLATTIGETQSIGVGVPLAVAKCWLDEKCKQCYNPK
jgi:hypothetical protein